MSQKLCLLLLATILIKFNAFAQVDTSHHNESNFKREFRGVWVATVKNIDWPTKTGETGDQQKQQLIDILNFHQRAGMNAIIFQVRPAADAFFAKSMEPWSKWLTGVQGQAPQPPYDPLDFAITEAHKRRMELHAWVNPYRATVDTNYSTLSPQHVTKLHPEWFFEYGGQKLFNPGLPEVRTYIVKVILGIVDNYDVDGIHMDDYFYPYPVKNQKLPDTTTYKQYGGNFTNIDDWRRNNVDLLIKMLADSIHAHKPRVKFGISPFSVWANQSHNAAGSDTHGFEGYYSLYADARKWAQEKWVDYMVPQLYRPLCDKLVAFDKMVNWWSDNINNRHLYIGQGPFQIIEGKLLSFKNPAEVPAEIRYLRNNYRVQGSVFFSSTSLVKNPLGVTDSLKNNYYKLPALPPPMLWLDSIAPHPPVQLTAKAITGAGVQLTWQTPPPAADNEAVYGYVVYRFNEKDTVDISNPLHILHIQYSAETVFNDPTPEKGKRYIYVVTAIDRLKNESEHSQPATVKIE